MEKIKFIKKITFSLLAVLMYCNSTAQITINNTLYTTSQLVNGILVPTGSGTTVSSVNFRGVYGVSSKYQVGYFTTAGPTLTALGFSSGIYLTTGNTSNVPLTLGTNPGSVAQMSTGYVSGTAGEIRSSNPLAGQDADAGVLIAPYNYYNAAILEFDFVPVTANVSFRYTFASEEYNDESGSAFAINYNCSAYNDKFAFLISGPGIAGGQGYISDAKNIARLANGSEVGINSVNDGIVGSSGSPQDAGLCIAQNPDWTSGTPTPEFLGFVNGTQYNGNTRILTATQSGMTPGATYHIRLLIADANDAAYDSGVFLEAGSFTSETASAGVNQNVCTNSATLNALSPASGTWTVVSGTGTFANSTSPNSGVTGLSAGANVFQWSNGTASSTVTITVNSAPTVTSASSNNINCTTLNSTLTGTSVGSTMVWNGGALVNAANPAIVSFAGTYTVTATNSTTGCTSTSTVLVSSNTTAPVVTSASSANLTCTALNSTLTGTSAGSTMVWNGGALVSAANPATVTAAGTYTVTATSGTSGCTSTSTVLVSSNTTPPVLTSSGSGNLTCTTLNSSLTGTSAGSAMVWNGGALVNAANPATVNAAGAYTVTATSGTNGCTSTSTVVVSSDTIAPVLTSASSGNLTCSVSSVNLTGTAAGSTMLWNGGALVNAANPATVSAAGTYTVTATNPVNGCTSTSTVTVSASSALPNISIATPSTITCTNLSVTLIGSSSTSGVGYQWTGGPTAQNYTVSSASTYTLTVTDLGTGCSSQQTVSVNSNTTPPNITTVSTLVLGCTTTSGGISANSTTAGATYSWSGSGITAGGTTASPTVNAAGTYTVTVTDPTNGCEATAIVIVTSNTTAPNLTIGTGLSLNCITTTGNITASSTTIGATYNWTGAGIVSGGTSATPAVNATGTYTVTITDPINGCTSTSTVIVNANPGPTAFAGTDISITANTPATLNATGGGSYLWSTGETTSSITVTPTITTDYCVTVADTLGCKDTACVRVIVDFECGELFVPNAFSPNNDGSNDFFRVKINPLCVKEMQLVVYDRWGEKIIEIADPEKYWDGSYQGKQLDNAVFVYYLKITLTNTPEVITKSGNVSLLK